MLATFADQQGAWSPTISTVISLMNPAADLIYALLTKGLEQSADKFYIKHAPTTSQEGMLFIAHLQSMHAD